MARNPVPIRIRFGMGPWFEGNAFLLTNPDLAVVRVFGPMGALVQGYGATLDTALTNVRRVLNDLVNYLHRPRRVRRGRWYDNPIIRQGMARPAGVGLRRPRPKKWREALWNGMDFWTARDSGNVLNNEQRAVSLLAKLCDAERVGIYCLSGGLPALGNVSRKTYVVRRGGGVDLLSDGRIIANYCISNPDEKVPLTDGVIQIKNLIEGEEKTFLDIARKWGVWKSLGRPRNVVIPHQEQFIPDEIRDNFAKWNPAPTI